MYLFFPQACKWSNYKIPLSAQNKEWFVYVDPLATNELLEELTEEFLTIYKQCPSRLKKKIKASTQAVSCCSSFKPAACKANRPVNVYEI